MTGSMQIDKVKFEFLPDGDRLSFQDPISIDKLRDMLVKLASDTITMSIGTHRGRLGLQGRAYNDNGALLFRANSYSLDPNFYESIHLYYDPTKTPNPEREIARELSQGILKYLNPN